MFGISISSIRKSVRLSSVRLSFFVWYIFCWFIWLLRFDANFERQYVGVTFSSRYRRVCTGAANRYWKKIRFLQSPSLTVTCLWRKTPIIYQGRTLFSWCHLVNVAARAINASFPSSFFPLAPRRSLSRVCMCSPNRHSPNPITFIPTTAAKVDYSIGIYALISCLIQLLCATENILLLKALYFRALHGSI